MSCEGKPIDYRDLRTGGQQRTMAGLGNYLVPPKGESLIGKPRDLYPGTLNAPYDPGQLAAMNTMMGMGGYGNYSAPEISFGAGMRVGPVTGSLATTNATTGGQANISAYASIPAAAGGDAGDVQVRVRSDYGRVSSGRSDVGRYGGVSF